MGCGCLKVRTDTDENRKKTMTLAQKLAEAENQTYVVYEKDKEEFADSLKGWEQDGRPGTAIAIVEP
jgi:hypothetical protein